MSGTTIDALLSGHTNVQGTLLRRHRELSTEIRIVESEQARIIRLRESLYKQRDQARAALTALGLSWDEEEEV